LIGYGIYVILVTPHPYVGVSLSWCYDYYIRGLVMFLLPLKIGFHIIQ